MENNNSLFLIACCLKKIDSLLDAKQVQENFEKVQMKNF